MALIQFYAGEGDTIYDLSASGLGFYGDAGFAASVQVGAWQGRTYITNADGSAQGPEADNVKYLNPGSGILGQVGSGLLLRTIPNHQSTLNVRFTHDTPVRVQNGEIRIFDRNLPATRPASGVTTKTAEIIHPGRTQVNNGSGDTTWRTPGGTGVVQPLTPSPGMSGLFPNGPAVLRHDWYMAISASPDTIGSKTQYGLYAQLEYL